MKSLMQLLLCVLEDSSIWCRASTTRDWLTIQRRVAHEGMSFLTISLPAFCSDFERSLADGSVGPSSFQGFHRPKGSALPAFLQGLQSLVFNSCSGCLLDDPSIDAIRAIRQICLFAKKVELPCSLERERSAYERYVECENEVTMGFRDIPLSRLSAFREYSRLLWGSVLQDANELVRSHGVQPKHGPGATAERISRNEKYVIRTWHERLQPFFPADAFAIPNVGFAEHLSEIDFVEPEAERPVRVISVPKTLKTPRIIAIEPVCMQYVQQSLMEVLVKTLESAPQTKGRVNFTDQSINQELALSSSRDGRLATLDLKEASDRVPVGLVEIMLEATPYLCGAVLACRSLSADVPGKGVVPLTKFASMGSALCFPVLAMVSYTLCVMAIHKCLGTRLSLPNLMKAGEDVRVYGDDIIVPTELALCVCSELEAFGLRVNTSKSFWKGKFRESCGMDAYDGFSVNTVRVTHMLPDKRTDAQEIISAIELGNHFYEAGYWRSAQYVRSLVQGLKLPLPIVSDESPISGRKSVCFQAEDLVRESRSLREKENRTRVCPNLHKPLVRGIVQVGRPGKSVIDGYAALMKCFLRKQPKYPIVIGYQVPFEDERHLERTGRPVSVDIKTRWASVV